MLNIDSPTRVVINAANVTVEIPISRLTIREYAKRTGETPTAVAHQIDDGYLPVIQPGGEGGKRYINIAKMITDDLQQSYGR